jgi:multicomponent Na+:H+ antiporter subunit B
VLAGGFLDNRIMPLGQFGTLFSAGAIPIIYIFVGLKVGSELSAVLDRFR